MVHFYNAYLYFVNLSRANPDSGFTFLAFLNNLLSQNLSNIFKRLLHLKALSWISYFPGADLKSLGSEKYDLTLILDLDENNFDWEKLTNEQVNLILGKGGSDYQYNENYFLNKPYQENYQKMIALFNDKSFWSILNDVLKNNLGIKSLFFNNEEYSFINLISSSLINIEIGGNNFVNLNTASKIELMKIIFGNKRSIEEGVKDAKQLQKRFKDTKTNLLTELKTALETLQKVDATITRLPINGSKYIINQLLQAKNQLLNDPLDPKVIVQIKALFSDSIYGKDVTKSTKQLEKYKEIVPFLTKLATDQKLASLQIKDQNYSFTSLITDVKKQFADFAKDSLDKLQKLVEDKITLSQLETAYQESLRSSATKSSTKKSTNKKLAIGLGTAGGVVALAGVGGFAYWFLKIRKS